MNSIDLTPLYRSSVGYDRVGALIDRALRGADHATGYPPYNIEVVDEDRFVVSLAVAGFERDALDITVENRVLIVRGNQPEQDPERRFLHQGIAGGSFERRFNLAEYVEVKAAELVNGVLTITLAREIPEAMKPRTIPISDRPEAIEHVAREGGKQAA